MARRKRKAKRADEVTVALNWATHLILLADGLLLMLLLLQ